MCLSFTTCDERCEGLGSHMHCHYCGFPLSLVDTWDAEISIGERKVPIFEALWECTGPKCKKTELVSSGIRETPLDCDCYDLLAD